MAAPNYAYAYGTTPSAGGGRNALEQAIKSMFLGVSTTISAAISSTGLQTVTPGAMTNIGVGTAVWINWGLSDQECVSVTITSGSTFTANFTQTHAANATVTCGLAILGATNPWSLVSTLTLTDIDAVFASSQLTSTGDAGYVPILLGHNSSPQTIGLATADDIDTSGSNADPKNYSNYTSGNGITTPMTVQDAQFSFWIVICEFGIAVQVLIGGTYNSVCAMALRTAAPLNQRGVGIASAAISSGATSVTLTTDVSSRLSVGQQVLIMNQSHNSGSANWAAANALMTIASVTSGGGTCTINFTGTVPRNFDTAALVGAVCANLEGTGGSGLDQSAWLVSHNNDGSWTSGGGNATGDSSVITSDMNSYESPTVDPQQLYAGELDLPILQTTFGRQGISGFAYCFQEFAKTSVNPQDVFFDGSGPFVWKAFTGSNAAALGPLTNPLNTQTAPTTWVP